ncbi:hypothetical protein GPZ77_27720 [Streptomyces sp. QHH-9511]|uniref:hypothetical protein n=1 Tax=Streptomyces sp. QHH-9511 TaxID=2684468 RepID=UPI001315FBFF|nr:hypothetical protein [Streptomyces sp. QHH-9511]QGZ51664.1 hypothetical protein GPZ77_27720 [Streptomyces sp. QHH-9511]
MEDRTDPVEIIARVGGTDPQRALEVWAHLAIRAGWNVTPVADAGPPSAPTECGVVEVEGLRYRVHVGPRVRHLLMEVVDGQMTQRAILNAAAWAEPEVSPQSAPTFLEG